ncbi:MAG: sn-glycerol-1-phosphate dehydrogenase [Oscillospiraceae bacterium]|nr:sn-glycerol-1-phosphate dehydrogenase [Oscillospiraceae bacterium]
MDINELLKGIDCSCGKHHSCDIQSVYIETDAILWLKELCAEFSRILLVADENTFGAAGAQTEAVLGSKITGKVIFPGAELLVPDERAIEAVQKELKDSDLIVGIGSGVIQDLCKYVSFDSKVPYMVVATAPSMDGYAYNGAAMITDGMKVTYSRGLPTAIIADTSVLKEAPMEMLKAGYGDIIGKFSALNDWKLSHCVNDEYFCPYLYDLTFEQVQKTLSLAQGILKREEESVKTLMEALVIVGILMSFAGSSRPASGSEHHLSHFFEITGIVTKSDYFPHGIDVAYSTVVTAGIREELLSRPFPAVSYRPERSQYERDMKAIYHEVAQGCMALQDKVGNYAKDRSGIYLEKETEIRRILSEMPSSAEILSMLELVEMDMSRFYELYGKEKVESAILYAKDLKDRYTVLWMNYDFFGGEKQV